jgi:sarcosine oxidase
MDSSYDVIVVGAGAVGSAAAYHAAKAGYKVLLLEQFEIDHGRGSSHGASRIIRYAYDHPGYVELAKAAFPAWRLLEEEAGETLMVTTGGVDFAPRGTPSLAAVQKALGETGIPYANWNADEARRHFPQFRLDDDLVMLYQADAGALRASRCVLAHVRLARRCGATVLDKTAVTNILVQGESVQVETMAGRFSAAKLILAAGSWMMHLLKMVDMHLPLTPVKCQENYFEADVSADYVPGAFPVFIAHLPETYGFMPYGLPSLDGSGVKVGLHGGLPFDPDTPERQPDEAVVNRIRAFLQRHLPGANGRLVSSRVCLYTMTPDEHFVLDLHPEHRNIVVASCCSGHGFKFSPVLGKIATDLALAGQTDYDISPFSAARFATLPQ